MERELLEGRGEGEGEEGARDETSWETRGLMDA